MTYLVNLTARAERDLTLLFETIHAEHSETALTWYQGLKKAILRLDKLPGRCPPTPENAKLRNLYTAVSRTSIELFFKSSKRNDVSKCSTFVTAHVAR